MTQFQSATTPVQGLASSDVASLRARYGPNELPQVKSPSPFSVLVRQFRSTLVVILLVAAVIALLLGERIDALAIALVLVLNAALGFAQEWRAEHTLEALRSMIDPVAVVVRDGVEIRVPARDIVPGDYAVVEAGGAIPADLRITAGIDVRADESVLTGESQPVEKQITGEADSGCLFAGTVLVSGRAEGIVTATGQSTRFGDIARLTSQVAEKSTNLQIRLGQLARQIGLASLAIAGLVVLFGWFAGRPVFTMFMTGLSLAVAMVPEGLPAVVTVTLALGASAMAGRNALVRRLQAVESLGAASVICTDKTGTLTENAMTVRQFRTPERFYEIVGTGYDPTGHIVREGGRVRAADDAILAAALETSLVCTHASLRRDGDDWVMIGDPTEGALVTFAFKGWAPATTANRVSETPFSSERKRMSVLAEDENGFVLHVKGAPETILDRSSAFLSDAGPQPLEAETRALIQTQYEEMSALGQRVLALATRRSRHARTEEDDLTFLGLVGMIDPPRPEIRQAVDAAFSAGIRVIMITGDGPLTALAVAREIGLGSLDVIDGSALDDLSPEALARRLKTRVLFARTRPEHKLRIVEALQAKGHVVAMTGDGVNDAPALKTADIGVAMGMRGTEVSRNAADLILLDDNFATIVGAVAEGRRQFENVQKFVRYLLCSNAGEVLAILANLALGGPLVFLATQILWMNLVTDSATAVALGLEAREPQQMRRAPRDRDAPILGRTGLILILCFGTYTAAASLWIFYAFLPQGVDLARTAAFTGMLIFEKVSVFAFRSLRRPVSDIGWFSNRVLVAAFSASFLLQVAAVYWSPLQTLLHTTALSAAHWLTILLFAFPLIAVPELVKLTWQWRGAGRSA